MKDINPQGHGERDRRQDDSSAASTKGQPVRVGRDRDRAGTMEGWESACEQCGGGIGERADSSSRVGTQKSLDKDKKRK